MVNNPICVGKDAEPQAASTDVQNVSTHPVRGEEKDIAITLVGERRHVFNSTLEAPVVRKIDLFLIPTMTIGYGLVYYDKVRKVSNNRDLSLLIYIPRQFWDLLSSLA
jgi:hypothetical protein